MYQILIYSCQFRPITICILLCPRLRALIYHKRLTRNRNTHIRQTFCMNQIFIFFYIWTGPYIKVKITTLPDGNHKQDPKVVVIILIPNNENTADAIMQLGDPHHSILMMLLHHT